MCFDIMEGIIIGDSSDQHLPEFLSHLYSRNHDDPMATYWAGRQGCKLLVMGVSAIMVVQYNTMIKV